MIRDWEKISLTTNATLKEAMQTLDQFGLRIVIIVNDENQLLGTVTDGDIRRGLLKGLNFSSSVSQVMNGNPVYVFSRQDVVSVQDVLKTAGILAVPVVDHNQIVIGLETLHSLEDSLKTDAAVVLMAGGFGKRLHPLTENLPKPMLLLGEKPILEHIIDELKTQGFRKFFITTHYKTEIIQEYFCSEKFSDIHIECIVEDEPLGTAGSLFLLKDKIDSDFLVMNGDLIAKTNFRNLLSFHQHHKEIATVCVKQHTTQVPYGVVEIDHSNVLNIIEKPSYSHFINTGVYCFNRDIFSFLNTKMYLDMPNLLQNILAKNQKISAFPLHEHWVDIGHPDDYRKANIGLE